MLNVLKGPCVKVLFLRVVLWGGSGTSRRSLNNNKAEKERKERRSEGREGGRKKGREGDRT
jgi:hypothetical protein